MGSIGGKDVADTTRNVLRNLMANTVASRMNFVGGGGKIAIKNMTMLHFITGKKYGCFSKHTLSLKRKIHIT